MSIDYCNNDARWKYHNDSSQSLVVIIVWKIVEIFLVIALTVEGTIVLIVRILTGFNLSEFT